MTWLVRGIGKSCKLAEWFKRFFCSLLCLFMFMIYTLCWWHTRIFSFYSNLNICITSTLNWKKDFMLIKAHHWCLVWLLPLNAAQISKIHDFLVWHNDFVVRSTTVWNTEEIAPSKWHDNGKATKGLNWIDIDQKKKKNAVVIELNELGMCY